MLDRLQSFRMREYVCIGTPEQIDEFRAALDDAGARALPANWARLSHR